MRIGQTLNFKGFVNICGYLNGSRARTVFNTDDICESDIKHVDGGTIIDDGYRRMFIPSDVSSTDDVRSSFRYAKKSDTYTTFNNPNYPKWE